jgi:hypothetical protein
MKTKLSELTPEELKAVLEFELLHRRLAGEDALVGRSPSLVLDEPMSTQKIIELLAALEENKQQ